MSSTSIASGLRPPLPAGRSQLRIFEPFFNTRLNRTGLALAVVSRLIALQDGTITLQDRQGVTSAEVMLPLAITHAGRLISDCAMVAEPRQLPNALPDQRPP